MPDPRIFPIVNVNDTFAGVVDAAAGANLLNGMLWRPRIWFERYLSESEWQQIWEKEVEWFRS